MSNPSDVDELRDAVLHCTDYDNETVNWALLIIDALTEMNEAAVVARDKQLVAFFCEKYSTEADTWFPGFLAEFCQKEGEVVEAAPVVDPVEARGVRRIVLR